MKIVIPIIFLLLIFSCSTDKLRGDATEQKIDSLMALMTLEEKVGQMNQYSAGPHITGPSGQQDGRYKKFVSGGVGSVLNVVGAEETYKMQKLVMDSTRLKIPLIFSYDVIHGYKTIFPVPLAEAASWDLESIQKSARIAAREAAAAGLQWTFAPMVDVSRDARWGRVMEGAGEDPYLGSLIADARIRGFQGNDLSDELTIAACAKHFAGYGMVESGKDYNAVVLGRNDLHNYVLPPFKQSVESGAATFMNAFNDIDGVPSTASTYLLRDLLKGKWNYDGVVVSDWNSIGELINHGVAGDKTDASILALKAGSDMDMEGDAYIETLVGLVDDGTISIDLIDDAVRRILRLKFDLGLFDDPYRYSNVEREKEILMHPDHVEASRDVARKSIVLLKNEGDLLPVSANKKIGIIGPLAKDKDSPIGNWRGQGEANSAVSFYEGMLAAYPESSIKYAEGCKLSIGDNLFHKPVTIEQNDRSGFAEALNVAKTSDVVFMVLGETAYMSGEARSRSDIGLPGLQLELLKEVYKVNKNIILVLMTGRPLAIPWEGENIPSILLTWHLGSQAGHAIADVVSGKYSPSGKLPMSFPRSSSQLPIYYNHRKTGRPENNDVFHVHHMDVDKLALYPFGWGLSYTSFSASKPEVLVNGDVVEVQIKITNVGQRNGKETIQLYITDPVASTARPVLELKSYQQLELDAAQSKMVIFTLDKNDFSYYTDVGNLTFEPGEFIISIGNNSRELQSAKITLN